MWRKATCHKSATFAAFVVGSSLALLTGVQAAPITYGVDLPVGVGSVTGTITTDGFLGTLFNGDITSWNLTLNDGTGTATMNPSNSSVFIVAAGGLSATASDLFFNFNSGTAVNFNTLSPAIGCPPQFVIRSGGGTACNGGSGNGIFLSAVLPQGSNVSSPGSGTDFVIGAVVPLPPAIYLFGSVLGGAFWMSRRKRSAVSGLGSA